MSAKEAPELINSIEKLIERYKQEGKIIVVDSIARDKEIRRIDDELTGSPKPGKPLYHLTGENRDEICIRKNSNL